MLIYEISADLFLEQEVGAVALASRARSMSRNVGADHRFRTLVRRAEFVPKDA